MIVRPLRSEDLGVIDRMERQVMLSPWSLEALRTEIEAVNGAALVAESGEEVCGYAFFRTCFPECELLRLVVAPEQRRKGVATAILNDALSQYALHGYTTCFLEVRASNDAARQLYAGAGFVQSGRRKNYYSHPVEDALLLFRKMTPEQEEYI